MYLALVHICHKAFRPLCMPSLCCYHYRTEQLQASQIHFDSQAYGHRRVVEALPKSDLNSKFKNEHGQTALILACQSDNPETVDTY